MNIMTNAQPVLTGVISPKPTVNIIVVAQQYDQVYCQFHGEFCNCFLDSHEFSELAMINKTMAIKCANIKLKLKIFTNYQICYLKQFLMIKIYKFCSLKVIGYSFTKTTSLKGCKSVQTTKKLRTKIKILNPSITNHPEQKYYLTVSQTYKFDKLSRMLLMELRPRIFNIN